MIRKFILLVSTALGITGAAQAQFCGTDQVNNYYKQLYPQIEAQERALNEQIKNYLLNYDLGNSQLKTTAFGENDTLHIPVVVHIVHDYGAQDYINDNVVYSTIDEVNRTYLKLNTSDIAQVLPAFQPYVGTANIMFHLATKDPQGNPTNGVTRHQSYLTKFGNDQAKIGQWDPSSYINIWVIADIQGDAAAYAIVPSTAAQLPYKDGIISQAGDFNGNKIIAHELAHVLNINHTWGQTNNPGVSCGDDDVDDTPPTEGELGGCSIYDTTCINTEVPVGKIIMDSARYVTDNNTATIDFEMNTSGWFKSVNVYPAKPGTPFDIVLLQRNGSGGFDTTNKVGSEYYARFFNVGNKTVDSATVTGAATGRTTGGIGFTAKKELRIEAVTIHPTTAGLPFKIYLGVGTDSLVDSVIGVTTIAPQVVNLGFYVPQGSNYWLYLGQNPGLLHDSANTEQIGGIDANYIEFTSFTTNGRYNYLYDWKVRYQGMTPVPNPKTPGAPFQVALNYRLFPGVYKLALIENGGLSHDTISANSPYNEKIPCVTTLSSTTINNVYKYMYNWVIRYGYIKQVGNDCIDYPDTVNTQNIMNYANCKLMFSKGQVGRMRATMANSVAHRDSLITLANAIKTGIYNPATGKYGERPELAPQADFSVEKNLAGDRIVYVCADGTTPFKFKDRSWRGAVSGISWEVSNGATTNSSGAAGETIDVKVTQPGWVDVKITANNSLGSTEVSAKPVYAADPNFKINPNNGGYFQEFNTDGDLDKWPIFNYYNNNPKWEVINGNGFFDKTCIMYKGFDDRIGINAFINSPGGDVDDFFSPAFDLSGVGAEASLNFMFSGAYRTTDPDLLRDTLEIHYSRDCGQTWSLLKRYHRQELSTKGTYNYSYAPLGYWDWDQKSIDLPEAARTDRTFFRFRYRPGSEKTTSFAMGTGNNFYLDRINISPFPAGVNTLIADDKEVAVAPNPTHSGSAVIIKNNIGTTAKIVVTDVTGKVVYTTQQALTQQVNRVEIPASAIAVKGMYMVQIQAGSNRFNEKLVVY